MAFMIYRAGDLHNSPPSQGRPGKRGILNIGKSAFYDVITFISPHFACSNQADRSVERVIAEGIAEAAAERDRKPQPRRRRRVTEESATA